MDLKETKVVSSTGYHKSVLVEEVLQYLNPQAGELFVDATFGGGGHTRAILNKEQASNVVGLDWDQDAIEINQPALQEEFGDRLKVVWGNFALIERILKKEKIDKVDGILADFGTSQFQIGSKAGFSFKNDMPLDMRMASGYYKVTAADILNEASQKELEKIFWVYGEERHSRSIAKAIVEQRRHKKFRRTGQLVELIEQINPIRYGQIHPATRVFQALRIVVNHELENIETFLKAAVKMLKPGGRLVCISFHSLEDRIVKLFFREHKFELEILTSKPVQASEDELRVNLSARSAKLRAALKL